MRTPRRLVLRGVLAPVAWVTVVYALGCSAAPPAAEKLQPADAHSATIIETAPAALDSSGTFRLAVMDKDGELIPIAEFRDGRWLHVLGIADNDNISEEEWIKRQKDVFGSMASATWYSAEPDGRSRVFKTPNLVSMDYHCSTGWALASVARQGPHDTLWPVQFALTVHAPGAGFGSTTTDGGAIAEIGGLTRAMFDDDETRNIGLVAASTERERERQLEEALQRGAVVAKADPEEPGAEREGVPRTRATLTPAERTAFPVNVTEIVSAQVPGTDLVLHHVNADRSYKAIAVTDCPEISYFRGWLLKDGSGARWLEHVVGATDCDGGAGTTDPLGLVRIGGATFLVAAEHGYEDSRYVIYEITGDALVERLTFGAGGC